MPFALVIIGLVMIVTGARDTYAAFGAQVRKDFTGPGNFTFWLASLGAVGAVGYVPKLKPLAIAFMTLIIVAMLLSNRGFFAKLQEALNNGPIAPPRNAPAGGVGSTAPVPGSGQTQQQVDQANAVQYGTTGRGLWADASAILDDPIGLPLRRTRQWIFNLLGIQTYPGTTPLEPQAGNPMTADPNPFDAPAPTGGVLPNNWFGN